MRPTALTMPTALLCAAVAIPALGSGRAITVGDNYFVRPGGHATFHLRAGQALTWRWTGQEDHNVTVKSGPQRFGSPDQSQGRFTHRFTRRGNYFIYCTIHGAGMSMSLRVG